MDRITTEFIEKSKKKFGNKFDYSLVKDIGYFKNNVTLICDIHGKITTKGSYHLISPLGCPICGDKMGRKNKTLTHEEFVRRVDKVFPNRKFRILGKYTQLRNKILLEDDFGKCLVQAHTLLTGAPPNIRTAINKNEYNRKRLEKYWGDTYDYSKFIYKSAKTKSIVICKIHGGFKINYNDHTSNKRGCPKCGSIAAGLAIKSNTAEFISKAKKIHGDLYNYSKTDYSNAKVKVEIQCATHNSFFQTPNDHLTGYGCPGCGLLLGHGFKRNGFIKAARGKQGIFYVIRCNIQNEVFYKIGITCTSVRKRYLWDVNSGLLVYETILEHKNEPGVVWDLEKKYLKQFYSYKFIPKIVFDGHTECFNTDLPVDEIISELGKKFVSKELIEEILSREVSFRKGDMVEIIDNFPPTLLYSERPLYGTVITTNNGIVTVKPKYKQWNWDFSPKDLRVADSLGKHSRAPFEMKIGAKVEIVNNIPQKIIENSWTATGRVIKIEADFITVSLHESHFKVTVSVLDLKILDHRTYKTKQKTEKLCQTLN